MHSYFQIRDQDVSSLVTVARQRIPNMTRFLQDLGPVAPTSVNSLVYKPRLFFNLKLNMSCVAPSPI